MPTLFDTLRERFTALQESTRSLQDEVARAGGTPTPEQESALDDLQVQLDEVAPRLERQAALETRISATAQLLARAPANVSHAAAAEPDALYRDAGAYLVDYLAARQGDRPAADRLAVYMQRAAANQVLADNPGIVPDPIVGSVLNFIDARRPVVDALGVRGLPAYPTFHRPHITQHTNVAKQTAEKTELASRKLLLERLTITAETFGGYVDLSLQDRDFTNPAVMGILVEDLAGQYAIQTETETSNDLAAGVTASVTAATADPDAVLGAIFAAAGTVYGASSMLPNVVFASVDAWAVVGPVWYGRPGNPGGSASAGSFTGDVAGLRLVVGPRLPSGTVIVGSTAGMEVYEQRVGTLQALEVSLLGMQVGYAGYFADYLVNPAAFAKVTLPPVVPLSGGSRSTETKRA